MTSDNIAINSTNFSVDKNGNMSCANANITGGNVVLESTQNTGSPSIKIINPNQTNTYVEVRSGVLRAYGGGELATQFFYNIGSLALFSSITGNSTHAPGSSWYYDALNNLTIHLYGDTGNIECVSLTQTSKEEDKKNFEKLQNALDIIKNIDIYKYNFKQQKDGDKKHIGFVIGDNYKYRKEITSENNDGVDVYSFVSVCCKAIQEQQEEIELLKEEIKLLKEGK